MLTIIIPGFSPLNKSWADETQKQLHLSGNIYVHNWRHWSTPNNSQWQDWLKPGNFDLDHEISEILGVIGDQQVNFIAKSIGTKVLMSILPKITSQINKVILCGIPIDPVRYLQGIKLIESSKLLIIQNDHDPYMPANLIIPYIKLIDKNITVLVKPATTHDYPYYSDFQEFLGDK